MEKQQGRVERPQGRRTERELDRLRRKLDESDALIKKLGRIIQAKDAQIRELRELLAKRERIPHRLPVSKAGNA